MLIEIPDGIEIPFSYGEALILTLRCEAEDPALIYRSLPTEGYFYDYMNANSETSPSLPQNPAVNKNENSFILPVLLGGAVLLAAAVAGFFVYLEKKQK